MTLETRGTSIATGWPNDVFFFTLLQEILYGWLKEIYPELELGTFLYKTVSCHIFCDEIGVPIYDLELKNKDGYIDLLFSGGYTADLPYADFVSEMGKVYFYIDSLNKAFLCEDLDAGRISTFCDILEPNPLIFKNKFYYEWANKLFKHYAEPNRKNLDKLAIK